MKKVFITASASLVAITILTGAFLLSTNISADDVVDDVAITVPVSCSLTGTNLSHTVTITNDHYTEGIGSASIKAVCNDTSGYSIYAVGYTGDTYGNNKMRDTSLGSTYDIATGKYIQGTTTNSVWSMKLTPVSGTYAPTIRNDESYNYTNYEVVPEEYTKVVTFANATDAGTNATGSSFITDYAVYVSDTQNAGTYTGKVLYTLVHPNSALPPIVSPSPSASCNTPVPGITYMQELDSSNTTTVMNNMTEGSQYYLRDARDEEPYCVSKIAGAIWMTQNLRITDIISSSQSDFTRVENFNPCTGDLTSGHDYDEPRCHDSGNTTYGVWYNYAAASAGEITGESKSIVATQSICPKNWTLPGYNTNGGVGTIQSVISSATAFTPVAGGYYLSGSLTSTSYGFWWSTTAWGGKTRHRLAWDGDGLSTSYDYRIRGYYIRCMRAL